MPDQELRILVKTEGDTAGLEKTKKGLDDLKSSATQASQATQLLATAFGTSLGLTASGAITAIIGYFKNAAEESRKLTEEINKQNESLVRTAEGWNRFAQAAKSQADLTSLANSFGAKLADVNSKLEELTRKAADVGGLERIFQGVLNAIGEIGTMEENTASIFATATDKEVAALEEFRQKMLAVQTQTIETANAFITQTAALAPTKDTISFLTGAIIGLIEEQSKLDTSTTRGRELFIEYQNTIRNLEDQIKSVTSVMAILDGQVNSLAADVDKQVRAGNAALQEEFELKNKLAKQAADEAAAAAQEDFNRLLREESTIIQGIRQQQELISSAPFMGADAQSVALLKSYVGEMQQLQRITAELQAKKAAGGLDPTQLEQVNQKLQQTNFQFQSLQQKVLALQAPLRTELTQWANSFGTTAQQIGKTIEGTIGVALQSVNQFLVTGKFNAQALLQQLVMLGLQLVEQMIIQRVMAAINAAASAGQAAATGPLVAAAWAPAATAATIATQGAAAATAPAAVAGALAAIMATLVVAHEGGPIRRRRMHSGGLAADEVPIIAQEGEIMIRRDVAQAPGMSDFLLGLNDGMFHGGGRIQRAHEGWSWRRTEDGFLTPVQNTMWRPSDISGWQDVYTPHEFGGWNNMINSLLTGQGFLGPIGTPGFWQGPTMIPTTFNVQGYPRAVPLGPSSDVNIIGGSRHFPERKPRHSGGLISRFHDGGAVGGGGMGGVHIYAFTDLKALTKHMGSKAGQKIIFDTVKGRRIDLGMK